MQLFESNGKIGSILQSKKQVDICGNNWYRRICHMGPCCAIIAPSLKESRISAALKIRKGVRSK